MDGGLRWSGFPGRVATRGETGVGRGPGAGSPREVIKLVRSGPDCSTSASRWRDMTITTASEFANSRTARRAHILSGTW